MEDVPEASAEELASLKAEQRKSEIAQRLMKLIQLQPDHLGLLRQGMAKLAELETEAELLRGELKGLSS